MNRFAFDRQSDLIVVSAQLWGPLGFKDLDLVLDTGAAVTLIIPDVLDDLGYSPRDSIRRTVIRSPLGDEPGYLLRVARFEALGFSLAEVPIHAHSLAEGDQFHGLLGLDFLRRFRLTIDFDAGIIETAPAGSPS